MTSRPLLIALALAATPLSAAAWCEDAGSSMVELKDCLASVQEQVELEMLRTWSTVQRDIAGRDFLAPVILARYAAAADRAQAAWRVWRAAECEEVTGYEWWGGTGAGVAVRTCMIETAATRVRDLTARYRLDPAEAPLSHGERK